MAFVIYHPALDNIIAVSDETVDAKSVDDVMKHIKSSYGKEAFKSARRMLVCVNKKSILLLDNYRTKLSSVDVVEFVPICAGG